ncbi:unnamed protein product [Adineta steineri]|uniref:PNPLA domain-containing protein n=1 Tax=Adineta steineri TaxID=433720 RepID=A0A818W466_9BILA|nr:unnamed protein product [Adineta steineri]CAF3719950.1 unnamed protein product [Adineta steineri]
MASGNSSVSTYGNQGTTIATNLIGTRYASDLLDKPMLPLTRREDIFINYYRPIPNDNYYYRNVEFSDLANTFDDALNEPIMNRYHYIQRLQKSNLIITKIFAECRGVLEKSIINEVQEYGTEVSKSVENERAAKQKGPNDTFKISNNIDHFFYSTSCCLMNYMFIFTLNNGTIRPFDVKRILSDIDKGDRFRMSRQAQYLKKTVSISKNYLNPESIGFEWGKKFQSALAYYVFFLIINPTLSSSHPLYRHSFNLAKAFITSSNIRSVESDSFRDSPTYSTEIEELLTGINNYETDSSIDSSAAESTVKIKSFHKRSKTFPQEKVQKYSQYSKISPYGRMGTRVDSASLIDSPDYSTEIDELLCKINNYETGSFIDSPLHSTKIKESLNKINNYEIDRLSYIITEFTDETLQTDNLVNINFTLEFSSSAAVLIAQNRSSELFDLYKISIGTFGSGMVSSISSLMENSFHNAMEITEQQQKFKNSFLHLARAVFRSKIDDWNGVNVDLELLNNSNVVNNCYYKELKEKSKEVNDINASILNKQQRIEYLLIRSVLCTSIGQFEDAFTALLDANYMININKSVSSQDDKIISDDFTTESKFESLLEIVNKYLQEHLLYSIHESTEDRKYLSSLEYLSDYFQNLNISIGTCSIKYDEKLLADTFNCYYDALATAKIKRNIGELQSTKFLQILTSLEAFLETLKMFGKQAPFLFNDKIWSNYIESVIKYDDFNENNNEAIPTPHQTPNEHESNIPHDSGLDEIDAQIILPTLDSEARAYYNILSLDGGGIRGIFEAIILMEIERRTGKYIGQLFTCFAGTSTGGILACGLAKRRPMTAKDLLRLYIGPRRFKIFKKRLLSLIQSSIYSSDGIEKVLKAQLPSERLSDCGNHDLIIPTEIHNQGPALFINYANSPERTGLYFYNPHEPNNIFVHRHSCNTLLRDAARCTSAGAPFFPHKTLDINGTAYTFYDGGYRFNRPDHIALKWATTVRQISMDKIFLLSLGNSNAAPTTLPGIRGVPGFICNTAEINEVVAFNDPGDYCRSELGQQYIRISPNIDTTVTMDASDSTTLSLLWEAAWKKITDMDNTNGSFNQLCIELLKRSNLPQQLVGDYPPPERVLYYPTRSMREPETYYEIDALFSSDNNNFDMRHENIPGLLEKLFESHRWPCEDPLQYPILNTYSNHRSLSLAAALGHIPSILHYLRDTRSINRVLTLREVNERDPRQSNGMFKWGWNSFHYAAANGEIIAALALLYSKPLELINLMSVLEESVLIKMIELLDQKTTGLFITGYSPAELANSTGYHLMEEELHNQRLVVERQLCLVIQQRRDWIGTFD